MSIPGKVSRSRVHTRKVSHSRVHTRKVSRSRVHMRKVRSRDARPVRGEVGQERHLLADDIEVGDLEWHVRLQRSVASRAPLRLGIGHGITFRRTHSTAPRSPPWRGRARAALRSSSRRERRPSKAQDGPSQAQALCVCVIRARWHVLRCMMMLCAVAVAIAFSKAARVMICRVA